MKLKLSPPCLIFYRPDLGTRDGEAILGLTKGPVIWIREDVKDDAGILRHELYHVKEFWMYGLIIHMILLNIPKYREWSERKALEVQMNGEG